MAELRRIRFIDTITLAIPDKRMVNNSAHNSENI
jgi:hypothetical protein